MTRVRIKIEGGKELEEKIRQVGKRLTEGMRKGTLAGGDLAVEIAKQRAPGPYIEREVAAESFGKVELNIGPDNEHWYYIFSETGATPHEIDGHVKKALMWVEGGEAIIVKSVKHPGIAAEPFLRPALEDNQELIKGKMIEVLNREIDAIIASG